MSTANDIYAAPRERAVIQLDVGDRAAFLTKTYAHLFAALAAFVLIEVAFFTTALGDQLWSLFVTAPPIAIFGGFVVVSWLASRTAHRAESKPLQYAALAGFVLAEAIFFFPLLVIAAVQVPGSIANAAVISLGGFAGLTLIVFFTRKDFSFLRSALMWGGFCAMGAIVASLIFGFVMGPLFSVLMIAFAGAAILYDTSNVLHHYPQDRYVSAALQLFASVAMLFWYVLRLLMSRD